jgi:hypothetical protein
VTSIISSLNSDDFLRITFYRLKNSNVSVSSQTFKVSLIDSSSGTGIVLSSGNVTFPLSVSSPPANLQINKITTASSLLLVRNLYNINVTTATNTILTVNSQSQIGIIVNFPNEYKLIWNRIETMPTMTVTFSTTSPSTSVTFSTLSMGTNGTLLANFSITSAFNFTQAIISFNFINPS